MLWLALLLGLSCACRPAVTSTPSVVHQEVKPKQSYSLQVTAAEPEIPFMVNASTASEWIRPRLYAALRERQLELKAERARYHFHVEYLKIERLTGLLAGRCQVALYLYDRWPGDLLQDNRRRHDEGLKQKNGPRFPPIAERLVVERAKARNKNSGGSILRQTNRVCEQAVLSWILDVMERGLSVQQK